jgi:signal transduction histidine kinase
VNEASRFARLPFLIIVALCFVQVAWWVLFQFREAESREQLEQLRLETLCSLASTSIAPATANTPNQRELFERELRLQSRFAELELTDGPGISVRPTAAAFAAIRKKTRHTLIMFTSEAIAFTVVILLGIVLLYGAVRRETLLRRQHESFLAGTTHEMRTPLATLRLGLQTLENVGTDSDQARGYLRRMVGQVDRLRLQIDNLLRTAAGDPHALNLLSGDLVSDLEEVREEFAPRAEARGVELSTSTPETPVTVRRDKAALQQALRNLVDNALKYSANGGVVRITLNIDEVNAVLRVRDDGPGVADEDAPLVFDRFYRGQAQAQGAGGTGLGLWVSRDTVTAHGGTIELSPSDTGACFELRLPLATDTT